MKHIAIVTASRADAGIYIPVIQVIEATSALQIVYEGGNPIACDSPVDVVVVLGDTMPMLDAAIWGALHHIKVAHIHGGDKTGSIDDKIRPAISSFADWHFPALPEHARRLERMGIPKNRIQVVGPLGIYAVKDANFISEKQLRDKLDLGGNPIIIVIQHPVWGEQAQAGEQMEQTLEALSQFPDYDAVIIYPNSEPGSDAMVHLIETTQYKHFKNLPYLTFISLLKYSSLVVGNSSCGLVEAPYFGVPCVNIGTRQIGRSQPTSTYNADYNSGDIMAGIDFALRKEIPSYRNPYDIQVDGAEIIAKTLAEI